MCKQSVDVEVFRFAASHAVLPQRAFTRKAAAPEQPNGSVITGHDQGMNAVRETLRNRGADTVRRPADEGEFSFEWFVHV